MRIIWVVPAYWLIENDQVHLGAMRTHESTRYRNALPLEEKYEV